MSFQRKLLLLGTLVLMAYFAYKEFYLFYEGASATLTTFQLTVEKQEASAILDSLGESKVEEMKWLVRMDYVFVFMYSFLLAGICAERMNFEHRPVMNNLLRLCILLCFLTGIIDIAENIATTHNLNYRDRFHYLGYLTIAKFSLLITILFTITLAWLLRWRKTGHFFPS